MQPETHHKLYVQGWKDAMKYGLMDGRPFSEVCIKTYSLYIDRFLEQYGIISVDTVKTMLMAIPIEHFAKRLKLYESVRSFAKYLIQEKVVEPGFLEEIKRYKPRRHLPVKKATVDQRGLDKLTEACKNPLERLIVILLSQTGLRVSEAAGLMLRDINFEERYLIVRFAKWGKTRRVGLTIKAIEAIRAYLRVRPNVNHSYLFVNSEQQPMERYGIRRRLTKIGARVGVKVSPHALRRAFVTINANKGRPLVMLQIACGHNDISTTRSYCMTTEDETIEAMRSWD